MGYQPIADYGIIGDLHSVALVGKNGCIDWCCLPRFDSPSIFGALLDEHKGGCFSLNAGGGDVKQIYLPNTNVLVTRFLSDRGMAEVIDFMPIGRESGGETEQESRQLVRIAKAIRGSAHFRLACHPAFDYGRAKAEVHLESDGHSAVFSSGTQQFALKSPVTLQREGDGVAAEFVLSSGEEAVFVLRHREGRVDHSINEPPADGHQLLSETARFWRAWVAQNQYHGRWREMVTRSALVLKLLTYLPTGAIVAAPTTSLPEEIGGVRNWDYRYTWVRDAAFSAYSLIRLGYTEEAAAFAKFMQARAREPEGNNNGPLNVMYGIDGRHDLREETLDHLEGYRGSRPVRIGNAAFEHLQLDIYGELMDSLYLYDKYGTPFSYEMWTEVERLLDWLARNWEQPDQGIWEVRGGSRDFTYSKLQCWVALDRGLRLGRKRSLPLSGKCWENERDRIYRAIMTKAWNEKEGAFTQYFGADAVDASSLLMPLMRFIGPTDPRMTATIDRVRRQLAEDCLVERYQIGSAAPDGLPGGEGFFTVCSFWLVEAMARAGYSEEAQLMFEKLLSFANHLGLFSEEISSQGELLGNFPQALTHLGLISAAFNLDRVLNEGKYGQR